MLNILFGSINTPFYPMKKIFPIKATVLAVGLLVLGGCAKNKDVDASITNIAVTNPDFQTWKMLRSGATWPCCWATKTRATRRAIHGICAHQLRICPPGPERGPGPDRAAAGRFCATPCFTTYTAARCPAAPLRRAALRLRRWGRTAASSAVPMAAVCERLQDSGYRCMRFQRPGAPHRQSAAGDGQKTCAVGHGPAKRQQVFVKPELTLLVAAVVKCNLQAFTLSPAGPLTVFAPTDQAFQRCLGYASVTPSTP